MISIFAKYFKINEYYKKHHYSLLLVFSSSPMPSQSNITYLFLALFRSFRKQIIAGL